MTPPIQEVALSWPQTSATGDNRSVRQSTTLDANLTTPPKVPLAMGGSRAFLRHGQAELRQVESCFTEVA